MHDIASSIERQAAEPLRALDGSGIPESITALVADMLDKDASKRPTASEVTKRLNDAGFAPGTATIRGELAPQAQDEIIESVEAIRPQSRPRSAQIDVAADPVTGLSRKTVGVSLGVLIAVLIGVIFVLPDNVSERSDPSADEPVN